MTHMRLLVTAVALTGIIAGGACHFYISDDEQCEYRGVVYNAGDDFPASDGCNVCTCQDDGEVACTALGCLPDAGPGGVDAGVTSDASATPDAAPLPTQCTDPSSDCCDACGMIGQCTMNPARTVQCEAACYESQWVETHGLNCLALRLYWINEEGCATAVQTYANFDLADDCQD